MTKEDHSEREHAELGGSSANIWLNCSGSVFLLRDIDPVPAGEAAIKGTHIHELGEMAIKDIITLKRTGETPNFWEKASREEDDDIVEAVEGYRDYVWKELLEEFITDKAVGIEEKLYVHKNLQMFGTVDFWTIYRNDKGEIIGKICDLKTGYHQVEIKNNPQLAFYAVALRNKLKEKGKDLSYCEAHIYQTTADPCDKKTKFTAKQLTTWENKFLKAGEQVYVKQKPKFKVGDWCKFCKAQAICPKYSKKISTETSLALADPKDALKLPAPEQLPIETILKILDYKEEIRDFVKSVENYAKGRIMAGKFVPEWKMVESATRRQWAGSADQIGPALEARGATDIYVQKLKPLTQVEKQLGKGKIDDLCVKTQPKPMLVPASDKRPAILDYSAMLSDSIKDEE